MMDYTLIDQLIDDSDKLGTGTIDLGVCSGKQLADLRRFLGESERVRREMTAILRNIPRDEHTLHERIVELEQQVEEAYADLQNTTEAVTELRNTVVDAFDETLATAEQS